MAQQMDIMDEHKKFLKSTSVIVESGTYKAIDMECNLSKYQRFKFKEDKKIEDMTMTAARELKSKQDDRRQKMIDYDKDLTVKRNQKLETIERNWKSTQQDKFERQKRDLQFEMATEKIRTLRKHRENSQRSQELVNGVDAFEQNLRRNGIGSNDEQGRLEVAYEDPEIYLQRIEGVAKKSWPTDGEKSDFMTQLKQRTTEKRTARYEKTRRRRRMLVDQQNALARKSKTVEATAFDIDGEELASIDSSVDDGGEVDSDDDDLRDEDFSKWSDQLKTQRQLGEDALQQFSETMRAEFRETETRAQLDSIAERRSQHRREKLEGYSEMCREIVVSIIAASLDAIDGVSIEKASRDRKKEEKVVPRLDDPNVLSDLLNEFASHATALHDSKQDLHSEPSLDFGMISSLDSWLPCAAIANSIGRWTIVQPGIAAQQSSEGLLIEQTPSPSEVPAPVRLGVARLEGLLEKSQNVLEYLLIQNSQLATSRISSQAILPVSVDEKSSLFASLGSPDQTLVGPSRSVIFLVVSDGNMESAPSPQAWLDILNWCGGRDLVSLWDTQSALQLAAKLSPLLEGKVPTITLSSLVEGFFPQLVDSRLAVQLSAQALRVTIELVDAVKRVLSFEKSLRAAARPADGFNFPFTDATFAIVLGQSLWLRSYTLERYKQIIDGPFPPIVIAGCDFSLSVEQVGGRTNDSATFVKIVDWFLRGGQRDNIPETELDMISAVQSETGQAGKPKGKQKPGKTDDMNNLPVSLAAVVCLSGSNANIVLESSEEGAEDVVPFDLSSVRLEQEIVGTYLRARVASTKPGIGALEASLVGFIEKCKAEERSTSLLTFNDARTDGSSQDLQSTAVSDTRETASVSCIQCPNDVSIAESFVALVLNSVVDAGKQSSSPDETIGEVENGTVMLKTGEESEDTVDATKQVLLLRDSRRQRLTSEQALWLRHVTCEASFDMTAVCRVYDALCESRAVEIELMGSYVMCFANKFAAIAASRRKREAFLIQSLKAADSRWQDMCSFAQSNLSEVLMYAQTADSEEVVERIVSNLVCQCGDVIDQRHMKWLEIEARLTKDYQDDLELLDEKVTEVLCNVCNAFFHNLKSKKRALEQLVSLLETSGYSNLPWLEDATPSRRKKWDIDRRRDELRSALAVCIETATAVSCGDEHALQLLENLWREFASLETPVIGTAGSLRARVMSEVYSESLQSATAFLTAMSKGIKKLMPEFKDFKSRMRENIRNRHSYEHRMLSSWAVDLSAASASTISWQDKAIQYNSFLSQYYFGVSSDVQQDSVEWLIGVPGLIELRDMTLPLQTLSALAREISAALLRQPNVIIASTEDAIAVLSEGIKAVAQQGHSLPLCWGVHRRLNELLDRVADLSPRSGSGSTDARMYFRKLFMTLLLGTLPQAPSTEYIIRLAQAITRSPSSSLDDDSIFLSSERHLNVEGTVRKAMVDSKISAGWWGDRAGGDDVVHALTVVAVICADEKGLVDVAAIITMLSMTPRLLSSSGWERTLLLCQNDGVIDNGIETAPLDTAEEEILVPAFLHDGFFKILSVAAYLRFESDSEADTGVDDVLLSKSIKRLSDATTGKKPLSLSQVAWCISLYTQHFQAPSSCRPRIGYTGDSNEIFSASGQVIPVVDVAAILVDAGQDINQRYLLPSTA